MLRPPGTINEQLDEGPTPFGRTLTSHVIQYYVSPAKRIIHGTLRRKGRMSGLMEGIPVRVIINPKAALPGAACRGMAANCVLGWEKEILL